MQFHFQHYLHPCFSTLWSFYFCGLVSKIISNLSDHIDTTCSSTIQGCLYLTQRYMVSVQDSTLIYTYLQLPQYYSRKVSSIQ